MFKLPIFLEIPKYNQILTTKNYLMDLYYLFQEKNHLK